MLHHFRKIKAKHLLWLFLLTSILAFGQTYITSKVSKAHKAALAAIFGTSEISKSVGNIRFAVLYSSGFQSSGVASCSSFSYLVFGDRDFEVVKARVKQDRQGGPLLVIEMLEGVGRDHKIACFEH